MFRKLTVEENLLAILETMDLTEQERMARLRVLLAELDLTPLARHKAFTLSGGERRRLEITRALVTGPRYLLARRALHRHRPHRHRRHPGDRRPPARARHRRPHHRPQRARDPRHHRPRVHPVPRPDPRRRHRARAGRTIRGPAKSTWARSSRSDADPEPLTDATGPANVSQRVVMTPLLQQAIQLLQLSTLELKEVVEQELSENPLLEEVQTETQSPPRRSSRGRRRRSPARRRASRRRPRSEHGRRGALGRPALRPHPGDVRPAGGAHPRLHRGAGRPALREPRPHRDLADRPPDRAAPDGHRRPRPRSRIGETIIGNLDEDGYLRAETAEIAEQLGRPVDEVDKVLLLVQGFDPSGVAARSIQECLLLQLRADSEPDPVSVEIVEKHMDDLERRRYPEIARVAQAAAGPDHGVGGGDPGPRAEARPPLLVVADSRYIAPDVTLQKIGDDYVVVLNDEGMPAPPRELALPLAPARLRGGGQAVRGAEAPLRAVAHQERGAAAAHASGRSPPAW